MIGISSYLETASWGVWERPAALIPQSYVDCVVQAGGVPVLLPPQALGAPELLELIDGLLLAGGPDIDPARYGAPAHPRTGAPHGARDSWEFDLVRTALERDVPVLGVCRGMQLLNVALGGELVQHLPDVLGDQSHQIAPAVFTARPVRIRASSRLAGILGGEAQVQCYHHQAVSRLGEGLLPSAWSADECVEAVELPDRRFAVGVQWHPEQDDSDLRLFEAFVKESRRS